MRAWRTRFLAMRPFDDVEDGVAVGVVEGAELGEVLGEGAVGVGEGSA